MTCEDFKDVIGKPVCCPTCHKEKDQYLVWGRLEDVCHIMSSWLNQHPRELFPKNLRAKTS